jgi:hypothetical protein
VKNSKYWRHSALPSGAAPDELPAGCERLADGVTLATGSFDAPTPSTCEPVLLEAGTDPDGPALTLLRAGPGRAPEPEKTPASAATPTTTTEVAAAATVTARQPTRVGARCRARGRWRVPAGRTDRATSRGPTPAPGHAGSGRAGSSLA